jgi:hypothetical protein
MPRLECGAVTGGGVTAEDMNRGPELRFVSNGHFESAVEATVPWRITVTAS